VATGPAPAVKTTGYRRRSAGFHPRRDALDDGLFHERRFAVEIRHPLRLEALDPAT